MFAPLPDNEALFYADVPDIPLTTIMYKEESNTLLVTLSSCSLDEEKCIVDDSCLDMNPYIDDYQVLQRADATVISLMLSDKASGYYAKKNFSYEPFFSLLFSK